MSKPARMGRPTSVAEAYRKVARTSRSQARAGRLRADALRELADAHLSRADGATSDPNERTMRFHARLALDLAKIVDAEADTLEREAARSDMQAVTAAAKDKVHSGKGRRPR